MHISRLFTYSEASNALIDIIFMESLSDAAHASSERISSENSFHCDISLIVFVHSLQTAFTAPQFQTRHHHPSEPSQTSSQAAIQASTQSLLYTQVSFLATHSVASCPTDFQVILSAVTESPAYSLLIEAGTPVILPTMNKVRRSLADKRRGFQGQTRIGSLPRDV